MTARQSRRRTSGGTAAEEKPSSNASKISNNLTQKQTRSNDLRGRKNTENSFLFVRNEHDCLSSEDANLSPRLPTIFDLGFQIWDLGLFRKKVY